VRVTGGACVRGLDKRFAESFPTRKFRRGSRLISEGFDRSAMFPRTLRFARAGSLLFICPGKLSESRALSFFRIARCRV